MDLKFTGKAWVGNFYQKFEALCHEVDDLVSQDTVKYVENQVQAVGKNVKRFCSDVVDLLPPLKDQAKCVVEEVSWKQDDAIGTYIKSMMAIEEKSCADPKASFVTQDPVDPLKDRHSLSLSDFCPVKQGGPLPTQDPHEGKESHLSAPDDDDAFVSENLDVNNEENTRKEEEQSYSMEISSPRDKNSSGASVLSEFIEKNNEVGHLGDYSPTISTQEAEYEDSQKDGSPSNEFLGGLDSTSDASIVIHSSEQAFSIVSYENKTTETSLISSSSSLPAESYSWSDCSHEGETMCCNPSDTKGCTSDLSSAVSSADYLPNVVCDDHFSQTRLDFSTIVSPLRSNDVGTCGTDEAVHVGGSSGNELEHCCECAKLETVVSSLGIGVKDDSDLNTGDPSMETIDLSDRMKLDESCVIVNDKSLYAVSCHARKFRSYKKMIQDAFASKKRLEKEYRQLPIYYGDVDIETSLHPEQRRLPPISTRSIMSKNPPSDDLCDAEWEVL